MASSPSLPSSLPCFPCFPSDVRIHYVLRLCTGCAPPVLRVARRCLSRHYSQAFELEALLTRELKREQGMRQLRVDWQSHEASVALWRAAVEKSREQRAELQADLDEAKLMG